jgi:hypothetical protein
MEDQKMPCKQYNATPPDDFDIPHFKCILRTCQNCSKYTFQREELALGENDTKISFHVYEKTPMCSEHGILPNASKTCQACDETPEGDSKGMFSARKKLKMLKRPLSVFLKEFYLEQLEKYAYHRPHFMLLGKHETGLDRKNALRPGDIDTTRDYAERLAFEFNDEIMSEGFGNSRSLSMEGCSVRFFPKEAIELYGETGAFDASKTEMNFHSHFSDGKMQNAATTNRHMEVLINQLSNEGVMMQGGRILDNTDGCAKQYRCATALYLLSAISTKFGLTIDRAIGAPGHGKDLVDGLNACDKFYLKKVMARIVNPATEPSIDSKNIINHSVVENEFVSISVEAARLCALDRSSGSKSDRKHNKRESEAKMKKRFYHVRKQDEKVHSDIKMQMIGLPSNGPHSGLLAHYHLHADPYLGLAKLAIRRIPCACESCETKIKLPWVPSVEPKLQPRFAQNMECKRWKIFESINDWKIVTLVPRTDCDPDDVADAQQDVLEGLTKRVGEEIIQGGYGAVLTEDEETHGYYVVTWTSDPYTSQDENAELVCDAKFLNPVGRAPLWYTPSSINTVFLLQHVVAGNLVLLEPSSIVALPNTCNRREATSKKAKRLSDESHEEILDEINRREILEYECVNMENDSSADENVSSSTSSESENSGDEG